MAKTFDEQHPRYMQALMTQKFKAQIHCAKFVIRKMRGGSQSLLVCDDEHRVWVTKFLRNPQHHRLLLNEYLATFICQQVGLNVPEAGVISISQDVLRNFRPSSTHNTLAEFHEPGLHFGSRYAAKGMLSSLLVDSLFPPQQSLVENARELIGMLVVDTWVHNSDRRQAVYVRKTRSSKYKAYWIDHGHSFGAGSWQFAGRPWASLVLHSRQYQLLTDWHDLEPWLSRVEDFDISRLQSAFLSAPLAWRKDEEDNFYALMSELDERRKCIRGHLEILLRLHTRYFPAWQGMGSDYPSSVMLPSSQPQSFELTA